MLKRGYLCILCFQMHLFLPLLHTSNQHLPRLPPLLFKRSKSTPPYFWNHCYNLSTSIPQMSVEAAKDALISEVSSHCCYGKKPAENMTVSNVVPSSAFHVCNYVPMQLLPAICCGGLLVLGLFLLFFLFIAVQSDLYFLQYQLETFAEGRNTVWAFEPFSGKFPLHLYVCLSLCLM